MPPHRRQRTTAPALVPSYRRFRSPARARPHYSLCASTRAPITPSHPASRQPARQAMPSHRRSRTTVPAPIRTTTARPHPSAPPLAPPHPASRQSAPRHAHTSPPAPTRTTVCAHSSAPPSRHRIQHRGNPIHTRASSHAPHCRPRPFAPASIPSYRRFRSPARAHRQKIAARENLLTRRCHTRGVRRALRAALSRCGE